MIPKIKTYIERDNGTLKVSISTEQQSNCCDAKILHPDFCADCGDHARAWRLTKIQLIKQ